MAATIHLIAPTPALAWEIASDGTAVPCTVITRVPNHAGDWRVIRPDGSYANVNKANVRSVENLNVRFQHADTAL